MTKVLISSRFFYPSLGGSETNAEILAREFVNLGQEVKVITRTLGSDVAADDSKFPFEVIRRPGVAKHLSLVRWCDAYLHNGISLRDAWPLLAFRRPWIVRHQGQHLYAPSSASLYRRVKCFIKRQAIDSATSISVSKAIAEGLNRPSHVILNPYRDNLFRLVNRTSRRNRLVYLGRLVSDKGVKMLIESFADLSRRQLAPRLTIIGSGPEEPFLRRQAVELGVGEKVSFVGPKVGEELVKILNEHQIMIVPSLWDEPFGVVALEGIACGCVIVGSQGGGLSEAIGPCGLTFPSGDRQALTEALADLLANPGKLSAYREKADSHLQVHKQRTVAEAYLRVIKKTTMRSGNNSAAEGHQRKESNFYLHD